MSTKLKILVAGDVCGNFKTLFKRVDTVNRKSGPFDYLLCVGEFFGRANPEWNAFKTGIIQVPVTTYVLGPNSSDTADMYPDLNGCELCPNISYLGKRGVFTASSGLRLAYISGNPGGGGGSTDYRFSEADVVCVRDVCTRGQPSFRGVDILLSSSWPQGITNLDKAGIEEPPHGSGLLSWLAAHIKPRYHFSGNENLHYERPPYKNDSGQGDVMQHSTRFIALAKVGNSKKDKWLYALSVTPLEHMRSPELYQSTTDETLSPFMGAVMLNTPMGTKECSKQFFYDMNASQDSGSQKRGRRGDGGPEHKKRERPEFGQERCWFCLASPQVEKHLVVSIGSEAYLAVAKGAMVDDHVLILPITHHQSCAHAPESLLEEIEKFKVALKKMWAKQKKVPVFYERNYKTSHLQIQAIPIPQQATRELREIFQDVAEAIGLELQEIPEHTKLNQIFRPGTPYFYVELPNGEKLYHRIKRGFPMNFGREVLASGPILNMEDRIDWRDCKTDKAVEAALVKRFRSTFEPYDFTL